MKRKLAILTAAMLASTSFAGAALAGEGAKAGTKVETQAEAQGEEKLRKTPAEVGAELSTEAEAEMESEEKADMTAETDAGTTASVDSDVTIEDAVAALEASNASAIEGMSEVSSVKVVKVSELEEGGPTGEFDALITANRNKINTLRDAIESNEALRSELDAQGVHFTAVVATEVGADGSLTVYTR